MSVLDDIAQLDPMLKTLGGVITALAGFWTVAGTRAWQRERRRQAFSGDDDRYDSARGANKRLFDYLEPRLLEMERRCDDCERREIITQRRFNDEMELMRLQYSEQITALKAEVQVLRRELARANRPIPPILPGAAFTDDTPSG